MFNFGKKNKAVVMGWMVINYATGGIIGKYRFYSDAEYAKMLRPNDYEIVQVEM